MELYHRGYARDLEAMVADPNARHLEVGAGRGTTAMYLVSAGHRVAMADLSLSGFQVARDNFAAEHLTAPPLVVTDAQQGAIRSSSVSCVYSIGLLEHFSDPAPILAESARVLERGGLVFQVIIPHSSLAQRLFAITLFAPWRLPRIAIGALVRRIPSRAAARRTPTQGGPYRSDLSPTDYKAALAGLGMVDVRCVPYNGYRKIHSGRAEAWLQVPVYRAHHAFRTRFASSPAMKTSRFVAQAWLLTGRKP
jgi:SAM-dependent methyltransferase